MSSKRISGLDVARGLAVLGMLAVHAGPDSVARLFAGRATALFAIVSGVSIALLSGRHNPPRDRAAQRAAARIAARAVLLVPIGLLLAALGTDIDVILVFYGLFFLLAIPALGLRPRTLALVAGVLAVVGPLASYALRSRFWPLGLEPDTPSLDVSTLLSPHGLPTLLFLGAYPAVSYMPFVFGGMAIGRLDLRRPDVAVRLLAIGAALAVVGYGGSWVGLHPMGGLGHILASLPGPDRGLPADELFFSDGTVPTTTPAWLLSSSAYSGTPFWILGAGGVAALALGGCLLLTQRRGGATLMAPLADLGAMVLSVYSLQIILVAIFGSDAEGGAAWLQLVMLSGLLLLFTMTWRRLGRLGRRGPLETLLHLGSTKTAQALVPPEAKTAQAAPAET